jgi:CheY-like chemotaxis protein
MQAMDILAAAADSFDLVLMDVQMPVMDGHTATREIRAMDGMAKLPIIAMTAHTMGHEKDKSAAAGMNDHIGKPFDEANFYGVLAKWIPASKQRTLAASAPGPVIVHGMPPLRGIDVPAGLALLQGNETRYRQWLAVFVTEMPVVMAQLKEDLAAGKAEQASGAAHIMKGRSGLLGMKQLHAIASTLEAVIDAAQPTRELLLDLEREVAVMCGEIRSGLGLEVISGATTAATTPDLRPSGPPPAMVTQLIDALNAGAGDCEEIILAILAELEDTPVSPDISWAPHLRQALAHIRNFNYVAAESLLRVEHKA